MDGAWGASAVLSRRLRPYLRGIELADSITWDAHRWLQVPMGAGMLLCRHRESARRAFTPATATYMPAPAEDRLEPYHTTMQWTRRFIGLKVLMTIAVLGRSGPERMIDHIAEMGDSLRSRLAASGWEVVNQPPLPLVCLTHPRIEDGTVSCEELARRVEASGRAWISWARIGGGRQVLRACITSHRTGEGDIDAPVEVLEQVLSTA